VVAVIVLVFFVVGFSIGIILISTLVSILVFILTFVFVSIFSIATFFSTTSISLGIICNFINIVSTSMEARKPQSLTRIALHPVQIQRYIAKPQLSNVNTSAESPDQSISVPEVSCRNHSAKTAVENMRSVHLAPSCVQDSALHAHRIVIIHEKVQFLHARREIWSFGHVAEPLDVGIVGRFDVPDAEVLGEGAASGALNVAVRETKGAKLCCDADTFVLFFVCQLVEEDLLVLEVNLVDEFWR
jgi:hypothetical protein